MPGLNSFQSGGGALNEYLLEEHTSLYNRRLYTRLSRWDPAPGCSNLFQTSNFLNPLLSRTSHPHKYLQYLLQWRTFHPHKYLLNKTKTNTKTWGTLVVLTVALKLCSVSGYAI